MTKLFGKALGGACVTGMGFSGAGALVGLGVLTGGEVGRGVLVVVGSKISTSASFVESQILSKKSASTSLGVSPGRAPKMGIVSPDCKLLKLD